MTGMKNGFKLFVIKTHSEKKEFTTFEIIHIVLDIN
jgi:hypothetical protein